MNCPHCQVELTEVNLIAGCRTQYGVSKNGALEPAFLRITEVSIIDLGVPNPQECPTCNQDFVAITWVNPTGQLLIAVGRDAREARRNLSAETLRGQP